MLNDPNMIRFTQISARKHEITLLVMTRPEHPKDYLDFYRAIAARFAFDHGAKLVSDVDVDLNPFRESATMTFTIKGYKHPEKHRDIHAYSRAGFRR